jgi:transposase InsO family protein
MIEDMQLRGYSKSTQVSYARAVSLLPETVIERPNQVWVSDITYIETEVGFGYLNLVTDAYSRFIVGYDFST